MTDTETVFDGLDAVALPSSGAEARTISDGLETGSDPTAGLDLFYRRAYDPTTGNWTQADPYRGLISEPQSLNRYAFVENNPASIADDSGFCGWTDLRDCWRKVKRAAKRFVSTAKGAFRSAISKVGRGVTSFARWAWRQPGRAWRAASRAVKSTAAWVNETIYSGVTTIVSTVKRRVKRRWRRLRRRIGRLGRQVDDVIRERAQGGRTIARHIDVEHISNQTFDNMRDFARSHRAKLVAAANSGLNPLSGGPLGPTPTDLGLRVAAAAGAKCGFSDRYQMTVCKATRNNPLVRNAGTTYGSVFISSVGGRLSSLDAVLADKGLLAHEYAHTEQWAAMGWGFAPAYLDAEGLKTVAGGSSGCQMFERAAGLEGGKYDPCRYG